MTQISIKQIYNKLAAYCSKAERCIHDIRTKLSKWEVDPDDQKIIIRRLISENFLNEERYCRAFVNDKSKFNKWGHNKIKFELMRKGISSSLICSSLEQIDSEENKDRLKTLLKNRKKNITGKNEYEINQKLLRYACSKGYLPDDIYKCLDTLDQPD